ncbi:hypothetical protein [Legionella cardiaca]|uniref:Ankyrin repeat protein n=1 Tax=Legionella cardiaca TaxID=1071983 RepID=A0ABY8AUB6_9GAMM|nr:hypothetical protein [Legionella cardiaca]WED43105.1 hypothetical protein PXX05_14580 [Legionella cardiaca]
MPNRISSPRAFSQLCEKANFSIFNNTFTIFPKPTGKKRVPFQSIWGQICLEINTYAFDDEESNKLLLEADVLRWVHREDADHHLFHQDGLFDIEEDHYHAQFALPIDEEKLMQILGVLKKYNVIKETEEAQFIENFHLANCLDADWGANFDNELTTLKKKTKKLEEKASDNSDYTEAAKQARALCTKLENGYRDFRQNRTLISFQQFQRETLDAIDDAKRSVLKDHRGWGEVLANLALAAAMLIIPYLVIGFYNYSKGKDFMFFKTETDSFSKLKALAAAVPKQEVSDISRYS